MCGICGFVTSGQRDLRIMMLNTQMEPAGAQKAMLELASGLEVRGYDVTVVTMYDKANYVPLFRRRYGVDIIDLAMKRPGSRRLIDLLGHLVAGVWRAYRLMRHRRIQILQTFSLYSNILGPFIGWLAGVPVRVSSQRMSLKGYPSWLLQLNRLVANSFLTHKMVAVSEGTRQFSIHRQGIEAEKLVTIRNGIDVDHFKPNLSPDHRNGLLRELDLVDAGFVVTTVARLHPQKGHRFLIEAMPQVLSVFPRTRFLFIGEGDLRCELEALVKQAGLDEAVYFLGVRHDVPSLLAISDLFVLPSLWEGLPNSVLEAMAAGVPVIATDVDGCPEIISNGETGLLVPPANPDALGQAICSLLKDESLRIAVAKAARTRIEGEFSHDANVSAFVDLYQSLVARSTSVE